jgi:hypothetical protein
MLVLRQGWSHADRWERVRCEEGAGRERKLPEKVRPRCLTPNPGQDADNIISLFSYLFLFINYFCTT